MTPATSDSTTATVVSQLVEAARIDTFYRDVYLRRARAVLAPALAYPEYLRFQQARRAIDETLRQTRLALAGHDWRKVQQLVDQIRIGRKELDANRALLDLAAKIYDAHDVSVFPFSRGLDRVFPRSDRDRTTLQNHVIAVLTRLEQEDSTFRRFYADRRRSFERLAVGPPHATAAPDRRDQDRVEIEAQRALDRGDLDQVERWVQPMLGRESQSLTTVATPRLASPGDLSASFPEETLRLAHRLGLASVRAEFDRESAAYLQCCCVWQATLPDRPLTVGTKPAPGCTCGHICPPDTSPALKDTLDLLIAHPFINSGGERYLPRFVAEDILVEEFPEDGRYNERAELPSALGLGRRAGLSRLEIEAALLHRGPEIVEHLSLDAQRFRLVCIPFDVYSRLAPGRHWGQQRLWTHFDGYQIWKAGKLRALVGGDVRYGGMYHLCSIGVDYEREEIVARFAVVRRERFADTGPDAA